MEPISWPPVDCHTFWPSRMYSPVNSTRPSAVTTLSGIGGPEWMVLYPTPPSTANDAAMTTPSAIHNLRYDMYVSSSTNRTSACNGTGSMCLGPVAPHVATVRAGGILNYDFCHGHHAGV